MEEKWYELKFKKSKSINYSQTIDDVYENLVFYYATKTRKVLIVFDYMIAEIEFYKNVSPIATKLFLRR